MLRCLVCNFSPFNAYLFILVESFAHKHPITSLGQHTAIFFFNHKFYVCQYVFNFFFLYYCIFICKLINLCSVESFAHKLHNCKPSIAYIYYIVNNILQYYVSFCNAAFFFHTLPRVVAVEGFAHETFTAILS